LLGSRVSPAHRGDCSRGQPQGEALSRRICAPEHRVVADRELFEESSLQQAGKQSLPDSPRARSAGGSGTTMLSGR
jgi:hypothetical protein